MKIQRTTRLLCAASLALAATPNARAAIPNSFQRAVLDTPANPPSPATVTVQIAGEPLAGQQVTVAVRAAAGAQVRLLIEEPRSEHGLIRDGARASGGELTGLGERVRIAPTRTVEGVADARGRWSFELRAPVEGTTLRFQAIAQTQSGPLVSTVTELTALAPYDTQPGDVVITEILPTPVVVAGTSGEWIEVYNRTSFDLDLEGWTLRDDNGEFHVIDGSVLLESRAYAVLAIDGDSARNGGVDALYVYHSFFLDDVADQVILADVDGELIDRVDYDLGPRPTRGASGRSSRVPGSTSIAATSDRTRTNCLVVLEGRAASPGSANPCCASVSDEDVPDLDFLDANCDGIDGDPARAIFVSMGGAQGNPGTMESPVQDIQSGILLASLDPTKDHVYVSEGTYVGTLVLADGVSVFGGYSESDGWARSNQHVTTIRAEVPVVEGMVGIRGTALSAPLTLGVLRIETADAPPLSGMHNYAVLLQQSPDVRLEGVVVDAGDGGTGMPGTDGVVGQNGSSGRSGTTREIWVPGYWVFWVWVPGYWYTELDQGGAGGAGACRGGDGGNGGAWDGYRGSGGQATDGFSTHGGDGGTWIGGGYDGWVGSWGSEGLTPNTPQNIGSMSSGLWVVDGMGTTGTTGEPGDGGGGGGGGSGSFGNALGHGGGGGGGGGWGGIGATGGRAGGSSVALFLSQSSAALHACMLIAGDGADGGDGGHGQSGGWGGSGGGTLSVVGRLPGGHGGSGGQGGRGGHGGGGGGGYSFGVLCDAASSVSLTASPVVKGVAGAGGISPETANNPIFYGDAKDGKPGQAWSVGHL